MPNYKLTLSYDGSRYNGWQKQGNTDNTIQQRLETLLTRLLAQPVAPQSCWRASAATCRTISARNRWSLPRRAFTRG